MPCQSCIVSMPFIWEVPIHHFFPIIELTVKAIMRKTWMAGRKEVRNVQHCWHNQELKRKEEMGKSSHAKCGLNMTTTDVSWCNIFCTRPETLFALVYELLAHLSACERRSLSVFYNGEHTCYSSSVKRETKALTNEEEGKKEKPNNVNSRVKSSD